MIRGNAYWTYDADAGAWYFGLKERASPPYLIQHHYDCIVDIDAEGNLAGIELLEAIPPSVSRETSPQDFIDEQMKQAQADPEWRAKWALGEVPLGVLKALANHNGHDEDCYYCGEKCDGFAGNPAKWPLGFPHKEEPGRVRYHHTGCVMDRLNSAQDSARKAAEDIAAKARIRAAGARTGTRDMYQNMEERAVEDALNDFANVILEELRDVSRETS